MGRAKWTLCALGCEERWTEAVVTPLVLVVFGLRQLEHLKGDEVLGIHSALDLGVAEVECTPSAAQAEGCIPR